MMLSIFNFTSTHSVYGIILLKKLRGLSHRWKAERKFHSFSQCTQRKALQDSNMMEIELLRGTAAAPVGHVDSEGWGIRFSRRSFLLCFTCLAIPRETVFSQSREFVKILTIWLCPFNKWKALFSTRQCSEVPAVIWGCASVFVCADELEAPTSQNIHDGPYFLPRISHRRANIPTHWT